MARLALFFFLICVSSLLSRAQTFPFTIRIQQAEQVASLANGGSVTVNSVVGRSESLTITLTYIGSGSAVIRNLPELFGSAAFQLNSPPAGPVSLQAGQTYTIPIRFSPRSSQAVFAQVSALYTETIIVSSNATVTNNGTALINLVGTAPELVISYIPTETQSSVPVASGGSIDFPATPVNGTSAVLVSVGNRGSGSVDLQSIAATGEDFRLLGLVLLPVTLQPNSELRFSIRFQPPSEGNRQGTLAVSTTAGAASLSLLGPAFQTRFAYEIIRAGSIDPLQPGATINLGEALPGESLSAQILLTNINPVAIALPSIAALGVGYSLSEVPVGRTLRPRETISFFLQVQLTQVGPLRGRLRIGDDAFDLVAAGSGAQLRYSYTSADSGSITLLPGGSVFFPPTRIGSPVTAVLTVRNNGISEANVVTINIGEANSSFRVANLPTLPARLEPGGQLSFQIQYSPTSAGIETGTLRIDSAAFGLSGSSGTLPPLPAYRFTPASANVSALDQPAVGLQLDAPYPVALSGQISLTQEAASFLSDPSVRFANGATTVSFTIPANTTQAIFANASPTIRMQTGSVAGVIIVRATFNSGTVSIPDNSNQALRLTILPAAPRILAGSVVRGANALSVVLTGLTLTRSLTKMDLEIRPRAGANLSATRFTINLEGESLAWFRNAASQSFGGIFSLQFPLNLSISGNTSANLPSNLIELIESLQVSLTNETGTSAAFSVPVQ